MSKFMKLWLLFSIVGLGLFNALVIFTKMEWPNFASWEELNRFGYGLMTLVILAFAAGIAGTESQ